MPPLTKTGGYVTYVDPGANRFNGLTEWDTRTCQHHGGLVRFAGFERLQDKGALCPRCGGFICLKCKADGGCVPIDDRLEMWEAAANTPEALEKAAAAREKPKLILPQEKPTAENGYLLLPHGFTPARKQ